MFRLLLLVYISMSIPIDVQYSDRNSYPWFILLPCIWQVFYSHFIIFASKESIVEHLSTYRGRDNVYHKEEFSNEFFTLTNVQRTSFPFLFHPRISISIFRSRHSLHNFSLSLSLSREREQRANKFTRRRFSRGIYRAKSGPNNF